MVKSSSCNSLSLPVSGAVPVATLNLQRGVKPGWTIPDAWHHQMVYGVSNKGTATNEAISYLLGNHFISWAQNFLVS